MIYENSIIPGFDNKAHKETVAKKNKLETSLSNWKARLERDSKRYKEEEKRLGVKAIDSQAYQDMSECLDNIQAIKTEIEGLDNMLSSGEFENIAISYNEDPYTPSEIGYSLGNENGRVYIGRNHYRMPLDHYAETYTASEYIEGTIPETNFSDLLTMLKTDEDASIMFDSDIFFGPGVKDDDRENVEKAISHAHDVGLVNAENKKAFEILRGAKDPITLDTETLQVSINSNLNAKGKANAVIVVNKSGFAKLDIEVGGISLVTRNADGNFIYKNKYVIQEVDNEVLPNNEDGSAPVIIGDMSIVKFFVMRDDSLIKDEFLEFKIHDRRLKREVIALTTTSDSAYIHGTLS